jgi:hypothetical protein
VVLHTNGKKSGDLGAHERWYKSGSYGKPWDVNWHRTRLESNGQDWMALDGLHVLVLSRVWGSRAVNRTGQIWEEVTYFELKKSSPLNRPWRPRCTGRALLFFNIGARWWCVVNVTPRPLYSWEWTGTHCTEGWVSPGAGLDGMFEYGGHFDDRHVNCCPLQVLQLFSPLTQHGGQTCTNRLLTCSSHGRLQISCECKSYSACCTCRSE